MSPRETERWFVPGRQPWRAAVLSVVCLVSLPFFVGAGVCQGLLDWLRQVQYAVRGR